MKSSKTLRKNTPKSKLFIPEMRNLLFKSKLFIPEMRSPLFKSLFSLKYYKDVSGKNFKTTKAAYIHYSTEGWKAGFDPSAKFSTTQYLLANPDVKAGGDNPLVHYLEHGLKEGRKTNIIEILKSDVSLNAFETRIEELSLSLIHI